jgi:hypothetical protein
VSGVFSLQDLGMEGFGFGSVELGSPVKVARSRWGPCVPDMAWKHVECSEGEREGSAEVWGPTPIGEEGESVVVGGSTCVDRFGLQGRPLVSDVVVVMLSKE